MQKPQIHAVNLFSFHYTCTELFLVVQFKKRCRDGVGYLCSICSPCVTCTLPLFEHFWALPSLHPTAFLENAFHTCLCAFFVVQ